MANRVDPDQMLHSVASDLGLHCLLRPGCPILRENMVGSLHIVFLVNILSLLAIKLVF